MNGMPSLELLNSTHQFPCAFTFKVFGTPDDAFEQRVVAAVQANLIEGAVPAYSSRSTPSGRHVCVTIEPSVRDAEHVHEIYRELQSLEGLFMLM